MYIISIYDACTVLVHCMQSILVLLMVAVVAGYAQVNLISYSPAGMAQASPQRISYVPRGKSSPIDAPVSLAVKSCLQYCVMSVVYVLVK